MFFHDSLFIPSCAKWIPELGVQKNGNKNMDDAEKRSL